MTLFTSKVTLAKCDDYASVKFELGISITKNFELMVYVPGQLIPVGTVFDSRAQRDE